MTKNAGRVANDLAMGTVYEFVTKMLVALQMTLPWVQSYAFGRFANDLAMDTVIRIRDENAGRFADVLALGAVIVFREENAGRLEMTSPWVQAYEFVTEKCWSPCK